MRSLILFRHGKSDWDAEYGSDHERPLTDRGRDAARAMGRLLQRTRQLPDMAISSSALRARDTQQLAAQAGRWLCPLRIESTLYEAVAVDVINWLRTLDADPATLLLTGHEPTWSQLCGRLIGEAVIRFPTACMARIDFEIADWSQIQVGSGELRWLLPPKLIGKLK